jgi:hypothetical protein
LQPDLARVEAFTRAFWAEASVIDGEYDRLELGA